MCMKPTENGGVVSLGGVLFGRGSLRSVSSSSRLSFGGLSRLYAWNILKPAWSAGFVIFFCSCTIWDSPSFFALTVCYQETLETLWLVQSPLTLEVQQNWTVNPMKKGWPCDTISCIHSQVGVQSGTGSPFVTHTNHTETLLARLNLHTPCLAMAAVRAVRAVAALLSADDLQDPKPECPIPRCFGT